MPRYRKRPVIVEAEQFLPEQGKIPAGVFKNPYRFAPKTGHYVITIHRQHAYLDPGDWVITESDGKHHYPCKPEEFERIYEPVPDEPEAHS